MNGATRNDSGSSDPDVLALGAPLRVAYFGGSFDPPHLGHLAVAMAAKEALALDTVLFAPVGFQPLKPQGSQASFSQRLTMTHLAISGHPGFSISLADEPRSNGVPNYTWGTLQAVRAELPAGSQLFLLMGADSLAGFRRWFRAAEIPFMAALIVASRPGEYIDDLKALFPPGLSVEAAPDLATPRGSSEMRTYLLRNSNGDAAPFYFLPEVEVEISASQIREQLRDPLHPVTGADSLLPIAVSDFIRAQGIYQ
jgi:nicotinate-nucleotide adenylyltransferase